MRPASLRPSSTGLACLVCCGTALAQPAPPAWMAGCWQGEAGTAAANAVEAWSVPRAGRMLGLSQTVRGTGSDFEYMRIDADERGLRFVPQPRGKPPVEFTAETIEAARVVFANVQHDFPKYIEYQRDGDRLSARLGAQPPLTDGRRLVFTFRRIECDAVFSAK
jgi:hypothetical protein